MPYYTSTLAFGRLTPCRSLFKSRLPLTALSTRKSNFLGVPQAQHGSNCTRRTFFQWFRDVEKEYNEPVFDGIPLDPKDPDLQHRHSGIQMHPDSISQYLLPEELVLWRDRKGNIIKRHLIKIRGHWWFMKDINYTGSKPILSNEKLIDENTAKVFPRLSDLKTLSGQQVNLPDYFLRKNRIQDAHAHCTLVAISFREYGVRQLKSWLVPFKERFRTNDRVEVVELNISEGRFFKWILRPVIIASARKGVPEEEYDNHLICFQNKDLDYFRDTLRLHNPVPGFVFLLDGLGRVRFAGSGKASEEESERLAHFVKELTPLIQTRRLAGKQVRRSSMSVRTRARTN